MAEMFCVGRGAAAHMCVPGFVGRVKMPNQYIRQGELTRFIVHIICVYIVNITLCLYITRDYIDK